MTTTNGTITDKETEEVPSIELGSIANGEKGRPCPSEGVNAAEEKTDSEEGLSGKMGCVYFCETHDGQFVKIGYSTSLRSRFGQIERTLRPSPIRLLGYIPGSRATELWIHQRFAQHRERGEWFRYGADIREFIVFMRLLQLGPKPARKVRCVRGRWVPVKNTAAVSLGRRGGLKGGAARAELLSGERRREIARKGGLASGRARAKRSNTI
jgi:hypothetical protein